MTEEEKDSYKWTAKSKFISKTGRKALAHAFNRDGLKYFSKYWKMLRQLANNRIMWEALEVSFTEYEDKVKIHKRYKQKQTIVCDESDEDDDEDLDLPSALPGTSTFVRDGNERA